MDMAALLALREMLEAGEIDEAGYEAAAAKMGEAMQADDLTADATASDDAANDDGASGGSEGKAMDMADDEMDGAGVEAEAPAVRPHGYEAMSRAHKGLHAWRKAVEADMGPLDNNDVRSHLSQHLDGTAKALKAMKMACRKAYKDHDELPDEYGDEDPLETKDLAGVDDGDGMDLEQNAIDGGMSALDGSDGGSLLGERPGDEEEFIAEDDGVTEDMDAEGGDDLDDEEAAMLAKSLPALERRLGLR
jgi:hypothetical protein